jgi:large subunit ribosomal protein L17
MAMKELHRKKAHREWLMRNLTTSLFLYERIETTKAKARELRKTADKMIVLSKKGGLANFRRVRAWLADPKAAKKLQEVLVPRYQDRTSGFTRQFRLANRVGDNAEHVLIELLAAPKKDVPTTEGAGNLSETPVETKRRLPSLSKPKAKVTVRKKGSAK